MDKSFRIILWVIRTNGRKDLTEDGVNKKDIIVLPMGINVPRNIGDIKKEARQYN